jgi:hypothetical protein
MSLPKHKLIIEWLNHFYGKNPIFLEDKHGSPLIGTDLIKFEHPEYDELQETYQFEYSEKNSTLWVRDNIFDELFTWFDANDDEMNNAIIKWFSEKFNVQVDEVLNYY